MCCISLAGSLCASFSSDNKLQLVITRATACLTVTCVLRIHDVSASNGLSFKKLLPYDANPSNYSPQLFVIHQTIYSRLVIYHMASGCVMTF